jgi:hypothetical protein
MKLDRTRFLALATAIAASGCIIENTTEHGHGGAGGVGGSETGGSGGTATGGSGGAVGGSGGAGGAQCDDEIGNPPSDCAPAASTVCGDFAVQACQGALDYFKPRIAELAADCILGLDPIADCTQVYDCRKNALLAACADPTGDAVCDEIVSACATAGQPTTAAECHGYVDGLNDAGRALMLQACGAGQGTCPYGIYSCVEGIL